MKRDIPDNDSRDASFPEGIDLECGIHLPNLKIAYCAYGTLNPKKDNAILICHAFTGDQYVASQHPLTGKPGWWQRMVGPGKPIDTDHYYVICSNILGGCMGTTGPRSLRYEDEHGSRELWGTDFPPITITDMVKAQEMLISSLGIEKLFSVIGGSMGGMQVLQWTISYPHKVHSAMPIATAPYYSAQNIAFNEVARQAIMADPHWFEGNYWRTGAVPKRGLAVARMIGHITYLSESALNRKFGRRMRQKSFTEKGPAVPGSFFGDIFEVESYLRYQGSNFVKRFDANSYLCISKAMDWFDIAADHGGSLTDAFRHTPVRFCVISFSSDWLFPTSASRHLVTSLNKVAANVSFVEISTDRGHDAFLLEEPDFDRTVRGFLKGVASWV